MDVEATQAIDFAEYDDETDDEPDEENKKKPVAYLKVLAQKETPERVFDIFDGTTVIGRDPDACQLCLPTFKSLSKQHACIEIEEDSHLIYDFGSRNKTRRDKLFLRPNVRYELKHEDVLTFGDVQCVYLKVQPTVLPVTKDNTANACTEVARTSAVNAASISKTAAFFDADDSDTDSDASSGILQPTEFDGSFITGGSRSQNGDKQAAEDRATAVETPISQMPVRGSARRTADSPLMNFVPESDSETDGEVAGPSPERSIVEETQAYNTEPMSRKLLTYASCQINQIDETQCTQVFTREAVEASNTDSVTSRDSQTAPTQVYEQSDLPTQTYEDSCDAACSMKKVDKNLEFPTQTYDMKVGNASCGLSVDPQTEATQVVAVHDEKPARLRDELPCSSSSSLCATQVFDSDTAAGVVRKTDSQGDVSATQVFDVQVSESVEKEPNVADDLETQVSTADDGPDERKTPADGKPDEVKTSADGKRLTFSPQTSSTQALSEADVSGPHLELDLTDGNESNSERRSSATAAMRVSLNRTNDSPHSLSNVSDADASHSSLKGRRVQRSSGAKSVDATVAADEKTAALNQEENDLSQTRGASKRKKKCSDAKDTTADSATDDDNSAQPAKSKKCSNTKDSTSEAAADDNSPQLTEFKDSGKSDSIVRLSSDAAPDSDKHRDVEDEERQATNGNSVVNDKDKRSSARGRKKLQKVSSMALVRLNEMPTEKMQVKLDKNVQNLLSNINLEKSESSAPAIDVYSMDFDPDLQDVPTQKFDGFVPPKLPSRRGKGCVKVKSADEESNTVGNRGAKRSGRNARLVKLEDLPTQELLATDKDEENPISARTKKGKARRPEAACDIYSMDLDDDLDNQPTQAFSRDVQEQPVSAVLGKPKGKQLQKTESRPHSLSTDELETQTFDQRDNIQTAESTERRSYGRKRSATKSVEAGGKTRGKRGNSGVSLIQMGLAEETSKTAATVPVSDASILLDVLATQEFNVQTLDPDLILEDKVDRGGVGTFDAIATQVFDQASSEPKDVNDNQQKRSRAKKTSSSLNSGRNKTPERGNDASERDEKRKSESKKADDDTENGGEHRRQSTRAIKGKRPLVDAADDVDSCGLSETNQMLSDDKKQGTAGIGRTKEPSTVESEEACAKTVAHGNGGKRRKLMPNELALFDEAAMAADEHSSDTDSDWTAKPVAPKEVLRALKQVAKGKKSQVKTKDKQTAEDNGAHLPVKSTGVRRRPKEKELIANSQMSDDGNLPPVSAFTAISPKSLDPENEDAPSRSLKKGGTRSSELSRQNRKNLCEDDEGDESDGSQELPLACKDPEEFQQKLSLLGRDGSPKRRSVTFNLDCKAGDVVTEGSLQAKGRVRKPALKGKETVSSRENATKTKATSDTVGTLSTKNSATSAADVGVGRQAQRVTKTKSAAVSTVASPSVESAVCESAAASDVTASVAVPSPADRQNDVRHKRSKSAKTDGLQSSAASESASTTAAVSAAAADDTDVTSASDSCLQDDNLKESNSRRSRRQPSEVVEKKSKTSSKARKPNVVSSASDDSSVASALSDAADVIEKPCSSDRGRGKTAAKQVVTLVESDEGKSQPLYSPRRGSSAVQQSVSTVKPKVMFTGVVDDNGEKTIKSFGGNVAETIYDCSHLVTDQVRRTVKFLCGVARGLQIVTPDWLTRCREAGSLVSAEEFLVRDSANEKKFQFNLSSSLKLAAKKPLLEGYKIHVTSNVKPEPNQMKDIIQCAGGKFVASLPRKFEDRLIVISCADDSAQCRALVECGIPVVTSEFLLTGILRQEVDVESHRLPLASNSTTPSRGGGKRPSADKTPVQAKIRRK